MPLDIGAANGAGPVAAGAINIMKPAAETLAQSSDPVVAAAGGMLVGGIEQLGQALNMLSQVVLQLVEASQAGS